MMTSGTTVLESVTFEEMHGSQRVHCTVDGFEIWCESIDLPLKGKPEAFASIIIVPCVLQGRTLEIVDPVCSTWYANVCQLEATLAKSWGVGSGLVRARALAEPVKSLRPARAQFFSGGVDSFYALLNAPEPVQYLVCVQGFDMHHEDMFRFAHLRKITDEVAAEVGARTCAVRTNLREHPLVSAVSWEDAHGGALAAVAHLLSPHIGSVLIPPSWGENSWRSLWGSHWLLDPLWSSSELQVIHGDPSLSRSERIRAIAHEPLVQRNLRVCWENRTPSGNCSQCAKCLRTMAVLHEAGLLHKFSVFDSSEPIWQRLDRLPYVGRTVTFEELLQRGVEPEMEASIKRLVKRSATALSHAECLRRDNHNLVRSNGELEAELKRLQTQVQTMAESRVWKAGNFIRGCRNALRLNPRNPGA